MRLLRALLVCISHASVTAGHQNAAQASTHRTQSHSSAASQTAAWWHCSHTLWQPGATRSSQSPSMSLHCMMHTTTAHPASLLTVHPGNATLGRWFWQVLQIYVVIRMRMLPLYLVYQCCVPLKVCPAEQCLRMRMQPLSLECQC
jgi:hypothetical protein